MIQLIVSFHGARDVQGDSGGFVEMLTYRNDVSTALYFNLVGEIPALIERLFQQHGIIVEKRADGGGIVECVYYEKR